MPSDAIQENRSGSEIDAETRLSFVNQVTTELLKNFPKIDRDRDQVLSPLELVLASENEKSPVAVRAASEYMDTACRGVFWDRHSLNRISTITSDDIGVRTRFLAKEDQWAFKAALVGAAGGIGCVGFAAGLVRSPKVALIGTACVVGVAGLAYLGGRYGARQEFDGTRTQIGNNSAGDDLIRAYLKK